MSLRRIVAEQYLRLFLFLCGGDLPDAVPDLVFVRRERNWIVDRLLEIQIILVGDDALTDHDEDKHLQPVRIVGENSPAINSPV
ncbi:hypothetical protein [Lihuaxuella thermophila]|uniref:hypothetical protein n=1 Tax=Lihuaxuella thermophila TaxID=1173111 RepID=UPI0011143B35|nr:hypothetical protein [Lihuaxuella thermophila]